VTFRHGSGVLTWKRTHSCATCFSWSLGGTKKLTMERLQVALLDGDTFRGQLQDTKRDVQLNLTGTAADPVVQVDVFVGTADGSPGGLPFGASSPQCRVTLSSADATGFAGTTTCRRVDAFHDGTVLYDVTATFSWTP
jgi:hypothetical protein